jgi:hypothetical protein
MGSAVLDAAGVIALVAAPGIVAVLDPHAPPPPACSVAPASLMVWDGPVRSEALRASAQARARARAAPDARPRALSGGRTPAAPQRRRKTPA